MAIYCVKEVEQNPLPKSQTKPFYIGTKEAPSVCDDIFIHSCIRDTLNRFSVFKFDNVMGKQYNEFIITISGPLFHNGVSLKHSVFITATCEQKKHEAIVRVHSVCVRAWFSNGTIGW